jgi:hypothetical protein
MFRPGEPPYLNSIINLMWAIQETVRVIMFCVAASVAADEVKMSTVKICVTWSNAYPVLNSLSKLLCLIKDTIHIRKWVLLL